jgi:transposase-like protein
MSTAHRSHRSIPPRSAFAGFRFPSDVIVLAVRWYLRFGPSHRDLEELLSERGVEVDHVTVSRECCASRRCWPRLGRADMVLEIAGQRRRYAYRAVDQFGQVIDVFVSTRRDATAAHRFFERAIGTTKLRPAEVTTDRAPVHPAVLEELLPAAWHRTDQYANNRSKQITVG